MGLEQAPVIKRDTFLVPEMNRQSSAPHALGTDKSSARRDGDLIDLRQSAGHEK
jgi:hypothetical protein